MNNQNAIHVAIASTIAAVLEAHGIAQRHLPDAIAAVTARMIEAAETGSERGRKPRPAAGDGPRSSLATEGTSS